MSNKYYVKMQLKHFLKKLCLVFGFLTVENYINPHLPDTKIDDMMKDIQLPPGTVEVSSEDYSGGKSYYYSELIEKDDAIINYYKKELISKGWKYRRLGTDGGEVFINSEFRFSLIKDLGNTQDGDYNWRIDVLKLR